MNEKLRRRLERLQKRARERGLETLSRRERERLLRSNAGFEFLQQGEILAAKLKAARDLRSA